MDFIDVSCPIFKYTITLALRGWRRLRGAVHGVAGSTDVGHVAVLVHPQTGPAILVKQSSTVDIL